MMKKPISYSPKGFSSDAEYDSIHFTGESSRLSCIFGFFSGAFQQCSALKQHEIELFRVLIWGYRLGCTLQLSSKNHTCFKIPW